MSELKAVHAYTLDEIEVVCSRANGDEYYAKSEADKCIALLKDKANYNEYAYKHKSEELADTCRFYEEELRHQKYKRCFAMAMWCFTKSNYHFVLARHGEDAKKNNRKSILYSKWHKRWLELAYKFKE